MFIRVAAFVPRLSVLASYPAHAQVVGEKAKLSSIELFAAPALSSRLLREAHVGLFLGQAGAHGAATRRSH